MASRQQREFAERFSCGPCVKIAHHHILTSIVKAGPCCKQSCTRNRPPPDVRPTSSCLANKCQLRNSTFKQRPYSEPTWMPKSNPSNSSKLPVRLLRLPVTTPLSCYV